MNSPFSNFLRIDTLPELPMVSEGIYASPNACISRKADTFFFELPTNGDLTETIMRDLFSILNSDKDFPIFSFFSLPNLPNELIIESSSEKEAKKVLKNMPNIGKISEEISIFDDAERIIENCHKFPIGKLCTVKSPSMVDQICQVIDIKKKNRVLVKHYPRIDYQKLKEMDIDSQFNLNELMPHDYLAPISYFRAEKLQNIEKAAIPIWGRLFDCQRWDRKTFIGEFQYELFNSCEILILNDKDIPEIAKIEFKDGMSEFEKRNKQFKVNFLKKENIYDFGELFLKNEKKNILYQSNSKTKSSALEITSRNSSPQIINTNPSKLVVASNFKASPDLNSVIFESNAINTISSFEKEDEFENDSDMMVFTQLPVEPDSNDEEEFDDTTFELSSDTFYYINEKESHQNHKKNNKKSNQSQKKNIRKKTTSPSSSPKTTKKTGKNKKSTKKKESQPTPDYIKNLTAEIIAKNKKSFSQKLAKLKDNPQNQAPFSQKAKINKKKSSAPSTQKRATPSRSTSANNSSHVKNKKINKTKNNKNYLIKTIDSFVDIIVTKENSNSQDKIPKDSYNSQDKFKENSYSQDKSKDSSNSQDKIPIYNSNSQDKFEDSDDSLNKSEDSYDSQDKSKYNSNSQNKFKENNDSQDKIPKDSYNSQDKFKENSNSQDKSKDNSNSQDKIPKYNSNSQNKFEDSYDSQDKSKDISIPHDKFKDISIPQDKFKDISIPQDKFKDSYNSQDKSKDSSIPQDKFKEDYDSKDKFKDSSNSQDKFKDSSNSKDKSKDSYIPRNKNSEDRSNYDNKELNTNSNFSKKNSNDNSNLLVKKSEDSSYFDNKVTKVISNNNIKISKESSISDISRKNKLTCNKNLKINNTTTTETNNHNNNYKSNAHTAINSPPKQSSYYASCVGSSNERRNKKQQDYTAKLHGQKSIISFMQVGK